MQETFVYQYVSEHARVRLGDTPSILNHIFADSSLEIETIKHDAPHGINDHAALEYIYMTDEEITIKSEGKPNSKWREKASTQYKINKFFRDTDWKRESHRQIMKQVTKRSLRPLEKKSENICQ